jgi:hypothetical protein
MRILLMIMALNFISCAKDLGTSEAEVFTIIQNLEDGVTFEQLQKQILAPKCLRCHAWVSDEEEVLKRVVPGEPKQSSLYTLVENGAMPVGGPELSDGEKKIVELYITGLAHNNQDDNQDDDAGDDNTDDDTPDTPPVQLVTFEKLKKDIFIPHCIRCHSSFENESGLDRYIDQNDPLNSVLLKSVETGFMPMRAPDLKEAEIQLIRDYLDSLSP